MAGKILMLENERMTIQTVQWQLEERRMDFKFVQYYDPFMQELKTGQYTCVSMDLLLNARANMKYQGEKFVGINILKEVRELYPDLPIACYTVLEETEVKIQVASYGAVYICKVKKAGGKTGSANLLQFFEEQLKKA